jgi:hypothetical protein
MLMPQNQEEILEISILRQVLWVRVPVTMVSVARKLHGIPVEMRGDVNKVV